MDTNQKFSRFGLLQIPIGVVHTTLMNEPQPDHNEDLTDTDLEAVAGGTGLGGGCEPSTQNVNQNPMCGG